MVQDGTESQGFQHDPEQETADDARVPTSNTISSESQPIVCPVPLPVSSLPVPSPPAPLRQARPRRNGGPGPFRRRRIRRLILLFCAHGPTEVSGLLRDISRGTLYRTIKTLVSLGLLKRVGRGYHTTVQGQRWLAEDTSHMDWNVFNQLYRPFALSPTVYHKGMLELIVAAAVVRKAGLHADHLCAFIAMGGTLRWKSTLGHMACATLGVDPTTNLLTLESESGRSVFIRRTSDGHLLSERHVLSSPLVVFDDYLQGNDTVRAAVGPFISGRRTLPYENGVIALDCVTLLTMNPRAKPTLEQQTTFNPAQLRRMLPCNFDVVAMPDLSLMGHRAVEAALQHGPLTLPVLGTDLQEHRAAVVQLVREVVRPEMHDRIDTEMLLILAAGMRGFIDDDERAVQQMMFDVGLMLETLGWVRPDWVTTVSEFSLVNPRPIPIKPEPSPPPSSPATEDEDDHILIRRPFMTHHTASDHDSYCLSEETRARLILMAAEEHITFTHAADLTTDFYHSATHAPGLNLTDLHSILALSKDLNLRQIPVKSVKLTLALQAYLHEHQLAFDHFDAAVSLLARLHQAGLTDQAPEATHILEVAGELVTSGMSVTDMQQWLAQRTNAPSK